MANKRLTDFSGKTTPAGNDYAYIHDNTSGQERKTLLSAISSYVLGGKTVGGTSAGDIANIDSSQTLTNKRLNSPGINSATALTADSAELNKLDGCTVTTAELNKLSGVTSNIQTQLSTLFSSLGALANTHYHYGLNVTTASTNIAISEATLRANAGITSDYRISHIGLCVQTAQLVSSTYQVLDPGGISTSEGQVTYTSTTTNGVTHLSEISIKCETATTYNVTVIYTAVSVAGGA
jgi:hypothetical protein